MSQLMHLAYISKSTITGEVPAIEQEVASILSVAQANNASEHITGALLYSGGYFCQVLEGEDEAITDLFETIQLDPRHSDVTVLHYEPLPERGFAEWSMAFAGVEEQQRFNIEGMKGSTDEMLLKETGRHLVSTLQDLVLKHQSTLN